MYHGGVYASVTEIRQNKCGQTLRHGWMIGVCP